jgi:hypothetical protein
MEKKPISHLMAGGIIGGIMILYSCILIILDQTTNKSLGWLSFLLIILALSFFIREKGNAEGNNLSFGELFSYGFKTTAFITIIMLAFQVIYNLIFPDTIDKILEITRQTIIEKQPNLPDEQIESAVGITKRFYWPMIIGGTILGTIIQGAIGSLIGAAITKKNPKTPFQNV